MKHCEYIKERKSDSLLFSRKDESKVFIIQKRQRKNTTFEKVVTRDQRLDSSVLSPQSKPLTFKQTYSRSNPFFSPNRLSHPLSQISNYSQPLLPTLTPTEKRVVKEKVKTKVQCELKKLKNRMISKIAKMNKIGVVPKYANEIRGVSLMSVESSFIKKKIPKLTRIAETDLLSKKLKSTNDFQNSRSQVLDKIKSVLLKDSYIRSPFSSLQKFQEYSRNILDNAEIYRV